MRILLITNQFHPPRSAGSGESSSIIYHQLQEKGHEVDLLIFDEEKYKEDYMKTEFGENYREPTLRNVLDEISQIKDGEYDIIHQYGGGIAKAAVPLKAKKFKETKTVTTLNGVKPGCFNYKEYFEGKKGCCSILNRFKHIHKEKGKKTIPYFTLFSLFRHYSKKHDLFFAQSEAIEDLYSNSGFDRSKFRIVGNFYDPKFYEKIQNIETSEKEDRVNILYVGRIIKKKGIDHLIQAFKEIPEEKAELTIVGNTPPRYEPVEIPDKENIELKGFLPYNSKELVSTYKESDIFVHPGIWPEPFNRTIIEAAISRNALVVSDVGAPPEAFKDEALIFKKGEVKDLEEKLRKLINNKQLREELMEKAFKKTKKKYSPEKCISKIEKHYKELINKNK